MNDPYDEHFYRLREEGRTYVSKLFHYGSQDEVGRRNVTFVIDGCENLTLGELNGALCLRLSGQKNRTQVTAMVTQDENQVKRLTLQSFRQNGTSAVRTTTENTFTFRADEFSRLLNFVETLKFIDLSARNSFRVDDRSSGAEARKVIVNANDADLLRRLREIPETQRHNVFDQLSSNLTEEERNLLLGRRQALTEFEHQLTVRTWDEYQWQVFFERNPWVFGYGLQYRISRLFDREMTVGGGGVDNTEKPTADFLLTSSDFTVLVEIKRPDTKLFTSGGRAGTRRFSADFIGAVSQISEQRAEWQMHSRTGEHWNKSGTEKLEATTRAPRAILIIGDRSEFNPSLSTRDAEVMRDTFELFRRDQRSIDILTFDEVLERTKYIVDGDGV